MSKSKSLPGVPGKQYTREVVSIPFIDHTSMEIGMGAIVFRLICAMAVGIMIGTEREKAHRPAGMRTHMLVALGSCVVMVTSQLLFNQYHALGSNADPARLSAQVIAGVGFLGAGTIIRDGSSVKGLTTAASIWTVACLGITIGAGYEMVGLVGAGFTLLTLIFFEWVQKSVLHCKYGSFIYSVSSSDVTKSLDSIYGYAEKYHANIKSIKTYTKENGQQGITFQATYSGKYTDKRIQNFLTDVSMDEYSISVKTRQSDAS